MNAPAKPTPPPPGQTAAALLEQRQERATEARLAVLQILLDAPTAQTHAEVAQAARDGGAELDRVTLYRVLDWLVEKGLAHKIAGEDRVWRFNARPDASLREAPHEHAHFHCQQCGRLYCLDELRPVFALTLPPGFRCDHAELTLRGLCPQCQPRS